MNKRDPTASEERRRTAQGCTAAPTFGDRHSASRRPKYLLVRRC